MEDRTCKWYTIPYRKEVICVWDSLSIDILELLTPKLWTLTCIQCNRQKPFVRPERKSLLDKNSWLQMWMTNQTRFINYQVVHQDSMSEKGKSVKSLTLHGCVNLKVWKMQAWQSSRWGMKKRVLPTKPLLQRVKSLLQQPFTVCIEPPRSLRLLVVDSQALSTKINLTLWTTI